MSHTSKGNVRSKTSASEKSPKAVATVRKPRTTKKTAVFSPERRLEMIAEAAYLRAEQRGFGPGDPLEDWLAAEREVDLLLAGNTSAITQ